MMKKLLTLCAALACTIGATATDYKGGLSVVLNGTPSSYQQANIEVIRQDDGKYELKLADFVMPNGDGKLYVGTIDMQNVEAVESNGETILSAAQQITIAPGSDPDQMWLGPALSVTPIPVKLKASLKGNALRASIHIPFATMGLDIDVLFNSTVLQIPNSGFEDFHIEKSDSKSGYEPNHWHSFLSATGMYASTQNAFSDIHTSVSKDVRPGTVGKSSILVKATNVFGIVANGTITTGRMNAGAMSATDPNNHAFLDITNKDKDANGDPFYTLLAGQPDSLAVWVKFKQATATPEHPYATVNAVITDGTRYQDPEDKAYSNVVAKATDTKIASEDKWVRLSIPFDYDKYAANKADTKAILVTISTNADPGKGSNGDELYVDDMELVYTPKLQGIKVFGNAVDNFSPTTKEYTIKVPQQPTVSDVTPVAVNGFTTLAYIAGEGKPITVVVYSEDLTKSASYTVKYTIDKNVTNGIDNATTTATKKVVGIYNLNGQQVSQKQPGQVYVIKYSDGTAVKELSK
ncbi:hypothetical protein CIK94_01580 [Prevotella sp. P4-51]|uniref:calycin-like domain-containing protein n=1 Tax=Prevotella sp. P4-51 TaxID=2024228 RepID=UPI000B979E42|nr:calycin-like domain-containing protein [Prevotella sp. P4-51]OYP78728.1 hypothetical protein CIK94_01580 [Prevotella sp. P4-51]